MPRQGHSKKGRFHHEIAQALPSHRRTARRRPWSRSHHRQLQHQRQYHRCRQRHLPARLAGQRPLPGRSRRHPRQQRLLRLPHRRQLPLPHLQGRSRDPILRRPAPHARRSRTRLVGLLHLHRRRHLRILVRRTRRRHEGLRLRQRQRHRNHQDNHHLHNLKHPHDDNQPDHLHAHYHHHDPVATCPLHNRGRSPGGRRLDRRRSLCSGAARRAGRRSLGVHAGPP